LAAKTQKAIKARSAGLRIAALDALDFVVPEEDEFVEFELDEEDPNNG
jgi:hypothetical protein